MIRSSCTTGSDIKGSAGEWSEAHAIAAGSPPAALLATWGDRLQDQFLATREQLEQHHFHGFQPGRGGAGITVLRTDIGVRMLAMVIIAGMFR